jgi:hypothetical protein
LPLQETPTQVYQLQTPKTLAAYINLALNVKVGLLVAVIAPEIKSRSRVVSTSFLNIMFWLHWLTASTRLHQNIMAEPELVEFRVSQNHWSYQQIIYPAGLACQVSLNKDATIARWSLN